MPREAAHQIDLRHLTHESRVALVEVALQPGGQLQRRFAELGQQCFGVVETRFTAPFFQLSWPAR